MRLTRSPSGEAQGKGRQLCRFVDRGPAAVADATFRRIGATGKLLRMLKSWGCIEIGWPSRS
jgi:hypothetical protein